MSKLATKCKIPLTSLTSLHKNPPSIKSSLLTIPSPPTPLNPRRIRPTLLILTAHPPSHLRPISHQLRRILFEIRIRKRRLPLPSPATLDAAEGPETESEGDEGPDRGVDADLGCLGEFVPALSHGFWWGFGEDLCYCGIAAVRIVS